MSQDYFVGVDVGTGSVRAGLFSATGKSIKWSKQDIKTHNPLPDHYEQSSQEIWNACLQCIKSVTDGINSKYVRGIGFDATCSLVVLDGKGEPLSVSSTGDNNLNVILWMDHRASKEADDINRINNPVLQYVGGTISLEMQTPKLMWLKRNMKGKCWDRAGYFFDLPDYLTFKATGSETRSLCSLVCKWTYEADPTETKGWNKKYFFECGLDDLLGENIKKIGQEVLAPGTPVALGLNEETAKEIGLQPHTPVGASLIDAHAGGLGILGCCAEGLPDDFSSKLALICGTSTCHMAVSNDPIFVTGVWGPYYSAMVPGMWLNEGGQSATGKLIDHIIDIHPASAKLKTKLGNKLVQDHLNDLIEILSTKRGLPSFCFLAKDVHVWPDFHGNRSPIADSSLRGMICGLQLGTDQDDLVITYLSTLLALAYGTKHIVEELQKAGHSFKVVVICGGLSKNRHYLQIEADVLNMPVVVPEEQESVMLGAAILGACAAKHFDSVQVAVSTMGGKGTVIQPDAGTQNFHNKKYKVFLKMLEHQKEYKQIMNASKMEICHKSNTCSN